MGFRGGAGRKTRLITLERLPDANTDDKDDFGEVIGDPVADIEDIRSAYEALGGREFPESQKRNSETTARFRIDYRDGLDLLRLQETHRVKRIHNRDATTQVVSYSDIKTAYDLNEKHVEIVIEVSEVR
jgi:hypothetical protein